MEEYLLQMKNICKHFPGVKALNEVHFTLKPGEVHVLLGENGAGKSTLIKVLSGAIQPDAGEIYISGKKVSISSPKKAQLLGVATIYQEFNLIQDLTVAENIFLGREPLTRGGFIDYRKMHEETGRVLDELDSSIDSKNKVRSLGIAEQQMVEIAKAISMRAGVLIMDEPTATLTDNEIKELFMVMDKLIEKGVGIIYISHRFEEVMAKGHRVTVLRDGNYIETLKVADADLETLIKLMVGRDLTDKFPKTQLKKGETVLTVSNLNKEGVLKDISFSLDRGEILGIAGLVGAGRTELANVIFGADKYESGQITVKGSVTQFKSPREAIAKGLGFVTEDRKNQGLVLSLSVQHNITLTNVKKVSGKFLLNLKAEKGFANEFCDKLRIKTPNINTPVNNLSGGNQQKVVLAKWLYSQADILIFDEPTRGIDVGAKVEVYQLMNELLKQGAAIIMISSEMPEILGMSDRIIVMKNGSITGEFDRSEATQEKILQCAMQ